VYAAGLVRHIRVLIADDHAPFAASVKELLATDDSIEVIGVARDGAQAVELAELLEPDVVLMDLDMPRMDGYTAAERIRARNPTVRIVIVTGGTMRSAGTATGNLGSAGFVLKTNVGSELLEAIRTQAAA
jgi:DNA-binding NarL/FixJ family response regulator